MFSVISCDKFDSDWEDNSECHCLSCDTTGTVNEYREIVDLGVPQTSSRSSKPSRSRTASPSRRGVQPSADAEDTAVAILDETRPRGEKRHSSIEAIREQLSDGRSHRIRKADVVFLLKEVDRLNQLVELLQRISKTSADDDTRIF